MRITRRWAALAIGTAAGILLIVNRGDLERLFPRQAAPGKGSVEDRAAIFQPAELVRVTEYHAALLAGHDIDYRVLSMAGANELERTAHEYFRESGVGSLSTAGRGLLLVIDPAGERVRLEVSTSLEGVYTDAFVAYVQNRQMVPFFAAGRVTDGILATTELIVTRAQEARAGAEFAPPMSPASMGGGASTSTSISMAGNESGQQTQQVGIAGRAPEQVVAIYHERMASRDARTDLSLYSDGTVTMLRDWVVTPAQMDSVARTYRSCTPDAVRTRGTMAVVRYRADQRRCAPYFLRREDDTWKLDLAGMSNAIRFNHENQWHFQGPPPADYAFAFEDWRLDRQGFPHPR
jgi:uncharacterized protein